MRKKPAKRVYALPSGKTTVNFRRYMKEWNALKKPLEKALGLRCIGYDPGFLFGRSGWRGQPVDIPVWLAARMCKVIEERDRTLSVLSKF